MADPAALARRALSHPWLPALLAALLALSMSGGGEASADTLVYVDQARHEGLATRTVHWLWIAVLGALGPQGATVLHALGAAGVVLGVGRLTEPVRWPAWVALGGLLPALVAVDVDLVWMAVLLLAVREAERLSAALVCTALLLSPATLLGLPFWAQQRSWRGLPWRRTGGLALALALTIVVLAGGGDWFVGERGVLMGHPWSLEGLLRGAQLTLPWALLLVWLKREPGTLQSLWPLLPLLAAPADVPLMVLGAAIVAVSAARVDGLRDWPSTRTIAVGVGIALGVVGLHGARAQLRSDELALTALTEAFAEGDAVIAPWRLGVRASVQLRGRPYRLPWRGEGPLLARQLAWCEATPRVVHRYEQSSFRALVAEDPRVSPLVGCR